MSPPQRCSEESPPNPRRPPNAERVIHDVNAWTYNLRSDEGCAAWHEPQRTIKLTVHAELRHEPVILPVAAMKTTSDIQLDVVAQRLGNNQVEGCTRGTKNNTRSSRLTNHAELVFHA